MRFSVRLATTYDLPALDQLYARSYPRLLKADYPPSLLVTVVPLFSKAQPRLVSSGSYFLAETPEGVCLGAGGWTKRGPMGEHQEGLGHIRHFATDPDALRQGVGAEIMNHCLAQATDQKITEMSCYSTRTALTFYEAMGFRKKGEMAIEITQAIRFPAIWMDRKL